MQGGHSVVLFRFHGSSSLGRFLLATSVLLATSANLSTFNSYIRFSSTCVKFSRTIPISWLQSMNFPFSGMAYNYPPSLTRDDTLALNKKQHVHADNSAVASRKSAKTVLMKLGISGLFSLTSSVVTFSTIEILEGTDPGCVE